MQIENKTALKCSCIKLVILVYVLTSPCTCSGDNQLGYWTDWTICQCATIVTDGFTIRFRKPVPGSGLAYKCHVEDEECIQFQPCSCTLEKYGVEINGDHRNKTSKILAHHGTPNDPVTYSFLDRMRSKRNAFYPNYYDYYNNDYGNDNYQRNANTGGHFESYGGNNGFQHRNTWNSKPWDNGRQNSERDVYFDYNEYHGYGNRGYDNTHPGFTTSDNNYYNEYQYGAIDTEYAKSYAYRTNLHMKHRPTLNRWSGGHGWNEGRFGHDRQRPMSQYNYQNEQLYNGYGQVPDLNYPLDNAYYSYENDAYVAHDTDDEAIPAETVVKLQSSQQQILQEIRKLNQRLQESKEVMAHFTEEIENLEQLDEAGQGGGFSK